jgi:hypothetical protein
MHFLRRVKFMKSSVVNSRPAQLSMGVLFFSVLTLAGAFAVLAQHSIQPGPNSLFLPLISSPTRSQSANTSAKVHEDNIPPGTILPVVLRTSFSFDKCKPGQILHGKIAQDIPLPNGSTIHRGSQIEGHIVQVTPAGNGAGASVSIQFDKLEMAGRWIPVVTNLRAIAGFVTVIEAGVPEEVPSEGAPYDWLPTTQIGGDSVYGLRGPVMSWDGTSEVVGKSVGDGVLARPKAKKSTGCRGELEGNDKPQALWVFSTDACGPYGIEHLNIAHAGRTDPVGTIVLASETRNVKLRNGDGLLLRVNAVSDH